MTEVGELSIDIKCGSSVYRIVIARYEEAVHVASLTIFGFRVFERIASESRLFGISWVN